ncbi:hypothetical protein BO71DRAFT_481556 [Aspergillus ellipticus CBS 707.79]|uniref:BTB domain-containing protein n=1 Tax=Aspergillus ellipticus CBS 707.79 TaxID=1448320 RepID=A0A319DHV9_9EURO|nr:hypothetical protein BO71DRAFT_481556 [Aspergillus ellipticus CBS 707.79]
MYFERALNCDMKEALTKELHFNECSPHAIWRAIEFIYTGSYQEEASPCLEVEDDPDLKKHLRVYVLADFILNEDLKSHALDQFCRELQL